MWIDQQGILHPKSVRPQHLTRVEMSSDSKLRKRSLSESVKIGSGYWRNQVRILHPRSATHKHVRFAGFSPVSSLNISDRVSIGSGYQPLPIPRLSGSWLEAPAVFQDDKLEVSGASIQETFGTVKPPLSNNVASPLSTISSYGHNVQNSSVIAQPLKLVAESQREQALSQNRSREIIYPRLVWEEDSVEKPELQNWEVYPDRYRSQNLKDNASPSVVSSVQVVELPAYSTSSKLQEHKGRKNKWNVASREKPVASSSKNWNRRSISSVKIIGAKDLSKKPINKSSSTARKSSSTTCLTGEITRKNQTPQRVFGTPKAMGVVRYTVPTSARREKTISIKVDSSLPSMDMIKVEHGHSGEIFIGNFKGACSMELCRKNNIAAVMNLSTKILKKHSGITYYAFPVNDLPREDIVRLFNMTSNIIEGHLQARENVLVNCNMGVSRSTTIVLAYIIKKTTMELDNALALCRSFRPCCNPNHGFIKQLQRYHRQIQERNSRRSVVPEVSYSETQERKSQRMVVQDQSGHNVISEVRRSEKKVKVRQRFPFSFPSCYARANVEDAPANRKVVEPRRSYSVL